MADNSLNSSSDDSRRELYERFRSELADDRRNIFFDEDDLIEIFDYATDLRDRYVALEVLFCAERLYPSSVTMAERKAVFYLGFDEEAAAGALAQLPDDSIIAALTRLRLEHAPAEKAIPILNDLLKNHPDFTDEEIIQLCDTAEELGLYKWLIDNVDAIKAHTDYTPTFLYELCQIAQGTDPDRALAILEELTMKEPFSIDFWLLTAQIHIEAGNSDKALQPLEYALAIEPDNIKALMLKAHAYTELEYPEEQIEAVLNDVLAIDPDIATPVLARAVLKMKSPADPEAAMEMLRRYNNAHPGNPQVLEVMLLVADSLTDTDPMPDIESFLTPAMADYLDNFVDLARRNADDGRHRSAAMLLLAVDKAYRLTSDFDIMMEELYRSGMYRQAVDRYREHFMSADNVTVQIVINELNDCFAAFWFILAAIRCGITEGLVTLVNALLASEPINASRRSIDEIFGSRGLQAHLLKIYSYLSDIDSLTIDEIDPFVDGEPHPSHPTTDNK